MLKPVGMFPQQSPLTPSPARSSGPGEPNVPVSEEIPPAFVYRDEEPLLGSRRKYLRIIPDQPRTKDGFSCRCKSEDGSGPTAGWCEESL